MCFPPASECCEVSAEGMGVEVKGDAVVETTDDDGAVGVGVGTFPTTELEVVDGNLRVPPPSPPS